MLVTKIGLLRSQRQIIRQRPDLVELLDQLRRIAPAAGFLVATVMVVLVACGPSDTRPTLEVITRSGMALVIARAELNYERICGEGSFKAEGDPDAIGLRYYVHGSDPAQDHRAIFGEDIKDIPWPDIAGVSFAELVGVTGGYCNEPDAITATVVFKDGHQEQRQLIDTTDRGLAGITERGPVVVPLRNLASLKAIQPENWAWLQAYDPPDPTHDFTIKRADRTALRVSTTDEKQENVAAPYTVMFIEKNDGHRVLTSIKTTLYGLPITRGGVRFDIPWTDLAHVGISSGEPRIATLTFNDRHEESGELPKDGKIGSRHGAPTEVAFREIAAIDISIAPAR